MKTTITFRQIQSSEAVKDFVNDRLAKLDRYQHKAKEAHVILSTERYLQVAEVVLSAKEFKARGKASTQDMYASIDGAVGKVEKTLKRHHDKKIKSKTHAIKEVSLL